METEEYNKYKGLIDRYSKTFYNRVSDMFELEDLAQQMWLVLLEAEKEDGYKAINDAKKMTYLTQCIINKMTNLVTREIRKNQVITEDIDTVDDEEWESNLPTPEELCFVKETVDTLRLEVKKIKHGEFVLDNMSLSLPEMKEKAKTQGIQLSLSSWQKKKNIIRKMVQKIHR